MPFAWTLTTRPPPTPDPARRRLFIPGGSRRAPSSEVTTARSGLPGPSMDLSTPAVPNHPGEPGHCTYSFLGGRCQASPVPEGWPLSVQVSRGRIGFTCVTADVVASPGFDGTVTRDAAGWLHGERAIPMISTSQLTRSTRLRLAHRNKANFERGLWPPSPSDWPMTGPAIACDNRPGRDDRTNPMTSRADHVRPLDAPRQPARR